MTAATIRQQRRRNHVDERLAAAIAACAAVLAGIITVVRGIAPTGQPVVDVVLTAMAVGVVVFASASAPWWALASAAALAAATSMHLGLIPVAVIALAVALWIGLRRRDLPEVRAATGAVIMFVLLVARLDWFHGASAIVGVAAAGVLVVSGLVRRRHTARRSLIIGLAATGGFAVVAVALFGASVVQSRQALSDGNNAARRGMDQMGVGDIDAAQASFERAMSAFDRAQASVGAVWTQPARLVPVVAQHRDALEVLAASAATNSRTIATELERFDLASLRVVDGRIDIEAVRALDQPLDRLQAALVELELATNSVRSPWLVDAVQRRLDDLVDDIDAQRLRGDDAARAIDLAPALLGVDGPRRYLIAFTTPVEARGHGGFLGNYAELTIDDGRIELSDFGRNSDLNVAGPRPRTVTGPEDWLDRYGPYGFTNAPGGTVGMFPWLNITMSPHFPSTAQVMAELYPQSGGRPVDGVFAMDVETVVAMLAFTGPIEVEGAPEPLGPDNAAQFLLLDQYVPDDNEQRVDLLEEVSMAAIDELLGGALPGPVDLARTLGPMAEEGRLTAWAPREDEHALFELIGMTGALPEPDGGDGVTLAFNNAGGNKIDNFLDVDVDYVVRPDPETSTATATLRLTMSNSSPTAGLPRYVIGSSFDLPLGTNRTWPWIFTQLPVVGATLDGVPVEGGRSFEQGYRIWSHQLDIDPGGTRMLELELAGPLYFGDVYPLAFRTPAAVRPFPTVITVERPDGTEVVRTLDRPGTRRLSFPLTGAAPSTEPADDAVGPDPDQPDG